MKNGSSSRYVNQSQTRCVSSKRFNATAKNISIVLRRATLVHFVSYRVNVFQCTVLYSFSRWITIFERKNVRIKHSRACHEILIDYIILDRKNQKKYSNREKIENFNEARFSIFFFLRLSAASPKIPIFDLRPTRTFTIARIN